MNTKGCEKKSNHRYTQIKINYLTTEYTENTEKSVRRRALRVGSKQ